MLGAGCGCREDAGHAECRCDDDCLHRCPRSVVPVPDDERTRFVAPGEHRPLTAADNSPQAGAATSPVDVALRTGSGYAGRADAVRSVATRATTVPSSDDVPESVARGRNVGVVALRSLTCSRDMASIPLQSEANERPGTSFSRPTGTCLRLPTSSPLKSGDCVVSSRSMFSL